MTPAIAPLLCTGLRLTGLQLLSVTLSPCPPAADLAPDWRALQAQADAHFFSSWTWIGNWLAHLPPDRAPLLLRVALDGETVGLGVVVPYEARRLRGRLRYRAAVLHATGRPQDDDITVEHNGLLVRRGLEPAVHRAAFAHLLRTGGFDEVRVPLAGAALIDRERQGASGADDAPRWKKALGLRRLVPMPGFAADLGRAGPSTADYIATLGSHTRSQIRRSLKRYAGLGPVSVAGAVDLPQALDWLGRLKALHQAAWTARGAPGAFANPRFEAFHQRLLHAGHAQGEVQVLRASAGDREVGYLLQFRHADRVLAYQSGFDYALVPGNHHPGLVVHALAMQHALEQGAVCYDFLGGEARYKRDLGGEPYPMGTWSLHRHGPALWAEEALRAARSAGRLARAALVRLGA